MSGEGDMEAFAFSSEGTRVQISKGVKASEHLGAGAGSASMPSLRIQVAPLTEISILF